MTTSQQNPIDSNRKLRVILVEDHPEYREVVDLALQKESDIELVANFGTAERAIRQLNSLSSPEELPEFILLDLNLPGIDGHEAIPHFQTVAPHARIIVLTQSNREEDVLQAIRLGAAGYLLKSSTVKQITDGIRSVAKGGASLDARVANFVLTSLREHSPSKEAGTPRITDREMEVLVLLAEGLPKKTIADQLSISTTTVVTHVTHIYEKLGAQNAPAAIAKAFRLGLLKMN